MNIALEKTEEFVNGVKRRTYGDAFVRGNNGMYSQSMELILTFSFILMNSLLKLCTFQPTHDTSMAVVLSWSSHNQSSIFFSTSRGQVHVLCEGVTGAH